MSRVRRPSPLVLVIVALLGAAALVVYLQHRALQALDRQTGLILQQAAEQTALRVADSLRSTFDGPVFDTLAAVNHPVLRAGNFEVVRRLYEEGLEAYPHVERFFLWHADSEAVAPGEVLFLGRGAAGPGPLDRAPPFVRDPAIGRVILDAARADATKQQIYSARHVSLGDRPRDVFIRIYYTDAARIHHFAVLGFVVDLVAVQTHVFGRLARTQLQPLLEPPKAPTRFALRVHDAAGRLVHGTPGPRPPFSADAAFSLLFYPEKDIRTRMARTLDPRPWTLSLSPVGRNASAAFASTETQGYWLSGLSVLLMLVALALVLHGHKQAEQLARMQADFVAHVSHQLKTPLALLTAVTETLSLERVRTPEKLAQYLDILRGETSRLSALVGHVLDYSRAAEASGTFEFEEVDLGRLVTETVDALRPALAREGVTLTAEVGPAAPLVAADPAALEQVVVNLVDNAVKYSGPGAPVRVLAYVLGREAVLEVADRGPGVPAPERTRIFERFYRGAGARANPHGFGLGLAIVREVVRRHGGRVAVDENPGGGSVFSVRLPLRAAMAAGTAPDLSRMPARLR